MEISRLIFITLLITCGVVTGHSNCDEGTISKLPDDQCLSDLDESALVITTATEETKSPELFVEKTTSTSTILDESFITHDHYVPEDSIQFQLQKSNNIEFSSEINTSETSPSSQSDSEEDMTHDDISTHPITLEADIAREEYPTTKDPRESTSELYYSNGELSIKENTEHLSKTGNNFQESFTVENGVKIPIIVVDKISGDAKNVEGARLINNESDTVMRISMEEPQYQYLGLQSSVLNSSNDKFEKALEQRDSKVDASDTSSRQSVDFDSSRNEAHIDFNRGETIVDNSNHESGIFEDSLNDKGEYESSSNMNDEVFVNREKIIIEDSSHENGYSKHSSDKEAYESTNNTSNMNDEEFLNYNFTSQDDYILTNYSINGPPQASDGTGEVFSNNSSFTSQTNDNGSNYPTNNPPQASELSSKNIEHVMMNDEFARNGPIEQFRDQNVEQSGNEPCSDCDLGILPVTMAGNKGKIENSPFRQSHAIPEASIQFADVPPEKDLRVDDLGLAEGSLLFSYLGELLSWLQPNDFPVELMRNALKNQISIIDLITESLKLEAGFIGCIAIGVSLALAAPIVVLAHTCYRIRRKGDEGDQTPIGCAGNCRRRTLVFFLQIIIFLLFIGTVAMLITNQQVSTAVLRTGDVLKTVLDDLDTFLQNVHHQLHFAVSKHLDQAVQAVNSDLDNVEILLGQPIQTELSRETGLDVALESLRDIAQDVSKVGESVELVQLAAGLLSEGIIMTADKLSDLRLQVNSFRRQCSPRDRPLCDTLNIAGLEVTLRVDTLRQDEKLRRIRQIGGPELRGAVESARVLFRDIPRQVQADTKDSREAVRRQLNQEQMNIDENVRSLDILVRNLKGKLTTGQNIIDDLAVDIPELEFWRWIIGLGAAGSLALLWILLQLGISCGCCGSEKSAGPTLLICVILICLLSTVLWLLSIIVFLIGGHGQAFICRPLYQEPEFPALSQLLDNPGLFPNSHKFISTLAFNNDTIDVPINNVLRECQENKPVYPVFKLNGVFNIETMTESKKWDKFHNKLNDIKVKLNHLKVLSPTLQNQLNDLLQGLSVNLTAHRTYLSSQVTGKDLNSFAAQLESVGNQIKDLATASRMETLASRTRRLIATHIEPLKEKKNNLLYQLTTLEVQLNPLQRQVEQSISHFKTIQFFIDNQGNSIADKKVKEYTHRLMRYIDQYKSNLADRINNNLARCQPLWKLFNTSRLMLCKHVMDPLNGFWFSTVFCLIILLCATPVCLKLVDCYKKKSQASNYSSGSPTENLMSNEHGRDWSSSNGTNDSGGGW